jgi:hypothetical protein
MAYEIHIERDPPFALDEWKNAVAQVSNLRLDSTPSVLTNPKTGDTITITERDGCVAVLVDGEWHKCFRFWEGQVNFNARVANLDSPDESVAKAAFELARILGAKVVGDEGEEYHPPVKSRSTLRKKKK